jgi:hypothetical protein
VVEHIMVIQVLLVDLAVAEVVTAHMVEVQE